MPTTHASPNLDALYLVLAQIPAGCVVSYGELAQYAGLGRAARWVGRRLAQLPAESQLPWHRVIRADGVLGLPANHPSGAEQRRRLAAEGIVVSQDRVKIAQHRWHPEGRKG